MKRVLFLSVILAWVGASCTTKNQAKANANAAFIAGQQQAWTQLQQTRPNSVRILGPVRQPILEWTATLTLAEAIVVADYQGPNPRTILVHRGGQAIPVDPKRLLAGEDVPLLPGDTVELRP